MLAFAAKGLDGNEGGASGGEIRHYMIRAVDALTGLADGLSGSVSGK